MKLHNSLGRTLAGLPPAPRPIGLYVCGITPYDSSHLGHARSAVVYDALVRFLRASGREVTYVRNITDVDDKLIERAGIEISALANRFIEEYHSSLALLGCLPPDHEPRVSTHIAEIISFVEELIAKGSAYQAEGSVYFAVKSFAEYGRLSNRKTEDLVVGARVASEPGKRDPLDFALWKTAKPGEPSWISPWSPGRPGWHIECSAMARRYLGDSFEIHGGGLDLIFPHHENERAQSKSLCGCEPAGIWMHNGLVTVDGAKMAKSLGNAEPIESLVARHSPRVLRFFLLSAHYSSPLDVAEERIAEAGRALERFENVARAVGYIPDEVAKLNSDPKKDGAIVREFSSCLENDFNTPRAFASLFEALREVKGSSSSVRDVLDQISYCGRLLNLEFFSPPESDLRIEKLIDDRNAARAARDFAKADTIRKSLAAEGILLEDTAGGTTWRRQ